MHLYSARAIKFIIYADRYINIEKQQQKKPTTKIKNMNHEYVWMFYVIFACL